MNLFGWLLLGHFVADWLLQSDWMAMGKRRHFFARAGIVHYLVYTATLLFILSWWDEPSLAPGASSALATSLQTLLLALVIFLSHWLIDGANLIHTWMRLWGQRQQTMVYLVIDQTLHLLVLGLIAAFLTQSCLSPASQKGVLCVTKRTIVQAAQWLSGESGAVHYPPAPQE